MNTSSLLLLLFFALSIHIVEAKRRKGEKLGYADDRDRIFFSIALPSPNEHELDRFLEDLHNPSSGNYRQFLTPEQFTARFGPTQEQADKLVAFLQSYSLDVVKVHPNRLLIDGEGPAAHIRRAFNCNIEYYRDHEDGAIFRKPDVKPKHPDGTLTLIGLDNATIYEHRGKHSNVSHRHRLLSPSGLSPSEFRNAYGIPSGYTGTGQTIGLIEYDTYTMSDVTTYATYYGLPTPKIVNKPVTGCTICCTTASNCYSCGCSYSPPTTPDSGQSEVTLDIQLSLGMAPDATILVYYTANMFTLSVINTIAVDNIASTVSTSWGLPEDDNLFVYYPGVYLAENLIFKQMATQGQSCFASSGDSGAFADGTNLGVVDPGAQPYVTSVGATTLSYGSGGSYISETTWYSSSHGAGSGGGFSAYWSIPSYQTAKGVITSGSGGSTTKRNIPDVSLDGDPNTGYATYIAGSWSVYGGTSASSPLWCAFVALVNEYRASYGQGRVGFLNPIIYTLGTNPDYNTYFNDIKDGSTDGYYKAVNGYDLCTGWGTIKGIATLEVWLARSSDLMLEHTYDKLR